MMNLSNSGPLIAWNVEFIDNAVVLKKGYLVKGGGVQKEYVTTLDKNMK